MPEIKSVKEKIAWGYANLAGFQVLIAGTKKSAHFMVRAKLYRGLCDDAMKVATLYKDERSKMLGLPCCAYCRSENANTADHLLPRVEGGGDDGSNLVIACRACNSAKGKKDVFAWYRAKDQFPPIDIMQRYIKLAWEHHAAKGDFDDAWADALPTSPFRLDLLPDSMPNLEDVALANLRVEGLVAASSAGPSREE